MGLTRILSILNLAPQLPKPTSSTRLRTSSCTSCGSLPPSFSSTVRILLYSLPRCLEEREFSHRTLKCYFSIISLKYWAPRTGAAFQCFAFHKTYTKLQTHLSTPTQVSCQPFHKLNISQSHISFFSNVMLTENLRNNRARFLNQRRNFYLNPLPHLTSRSKCM